MRVKFLAMACLATLMAASSAQAQKAVGGPGFEALKLPAETKALLVESQIDVTAWIGDANGRAFFKRGGGDVMPTASAIKAFYLVEFFAKHADRLDEPLPNAKDHLTGDHPAVSHFAPDVREAIRKELTAASVRRIGLIMQGRTDVSNAIYNAAANLVTADLGGPEALTDLVHARDPRFRTVAVRRYMLRDRTKPGDNEATADAFAALHQALSTRKLNGISDSVMTAVHEVLKRPGSDPPVFYKDGALGSDPLTSVRAGWKETPAGPVIFVVMCRQPIKNPTGSAGDYKRIQELSASLRDALLATATGKSTEAKVGTP